MKVEFGASLIPHFRPGDSITGTGGVRERKELLRRAKQEAASNTLKLLNEACKALEKDLPNRGSCIIVTPIPKRVNISSIFRKRVEAMVIDRGQDPAEPIAYIRYRRNIIDRVGVIPEITPIAHDKGTFFIYHLTRLFKDLHGFDPSDAIRKSEKRFAIKLAASIVAFGLIPSAWNIFVDKLDADQKLNLERSSLQRDIKAKLEPNIKDLLSPNRKQTKVQIPGPNNTVLIRDVSEVVQELKLAEWTLDHNQPLSAKECKDHRLALELLIRNTESDDAIQKRQPVGGAWGENVSVYTSTSNTYSWNNRYTDAISNSIQKGATSLEQAHRAAVYSLVRDSIYISPGEAKTQIANIAKYTGADKAKSMISPGLYFEVPEATIKPGTSWTFERGKGEFLIVVGNTHPWEEKDRFTKSAFYMKHTFESRLQRHVEILEKPNSEQLNTKLKEMGRKGIKDPEGQVMIVFIAHGISDWNGDSFEDASISSGTIKLRSDYLINESELKKMINSEISPNFQNVNLIFGSCFSGVWQR